MYNENKLDKAQPFYPPVYGNETCNTSEFKEIIDVMVPVTIEPKAEVGKVTVSVIGEPCVRPIPCVNMSGNGICKFLVTQKLCVQVPITFNATAKATDGLSTDCISNKCPRSYNC